MQPYQHQIEGAEWAINTMRVHGLAYLAHKERTGKTLTAILTAEQSLAENILVLTKKKAIAGWEETLAQFKHSKNYVVINYESLHKVAKLDYGFIILDEAHHALSACPKPSATWKRVAEVAKGKALLYLSATPYAEHVGLLYHQLKLSSWSPFRSIRTFYDFHRQFGIPSMTRTPYGLVETYTKYNTAKVLAEVEHLFNFKTRQDVGIEHEPEAQLVYVDPHKETVAMVTKLQDDKLLKIGNDTLVCDSTMKLSMAHYQMECGTVKINDQKSIWLPHHEKLDYIKKNYDLKTTALMCHFIEERAMYKALLPELTVLSSDGDAEGVDLSHFKKLVISSMSFKTSKHTQRLARQANHNRTTPIMVDVLVMGKPFIGAKVYNTVAVKMENFNSASYNRIGA